MVKINFIKNYLVDREFKSVNISMFGIIKFNIEINKFGYEINSNVLTIKDNDEFIMDIVFNEVKNVEIDKCNVIINFNFNEKVIIRK